MTEIKAYVTGTNIRQSIWSLRDAPFVVLTIASISIGYFVSLWVTSVMHSGTDKRRQYLFRLHFYSKKKIKEKELNTRTSAYLSNPKNKLHEDGRRLFPKIHVKFQIPHTFTKPANFLSFCVNRYSGWKKKNINH